MKLNVLPYQSMTAFRGVALSLLCILHFSLTATAAAAVPADDKPGCDTICTFTQKILFPKSSAILSPAFAENRTHIDSIRSFLSASDSGRFLSVSIAGSYSPEGRCAFNTRLADARAKALASLVREIAPGVGAELSVRHPSKGTKTPYRQMRAAELTIVYRDSTQPCDAVDVCTQRHDAQTFADTAVSKPEKEEIDKCPPPSQLDTPASSITEDRAQAPERQDASDRYAAAGNRAASRLFVTTNMLYDAALTPNIGVGASVTDRISVLADWMYARWNNRDRRRYWRIYGGDIEARYRIGKRRGSPLGGHHIGVYGSLACYDFQAGRSHRGVLSDKWNYAVGLSYTYSLPVSTHFNIDFSLGIGYLWGNYKKCETIDDCDVWLSTHRLGWFGPTRAGVSLVWLVGGAVKNDRKGGAK